MRELNERLARLVEEMRDLRKDIETLRVEWETEQKETDELIEALLAELRMARAR